MTPASDGFQLLRQKTENQLRDIAGRARGVLGFMAIDLTSGESFALNEHTVFPQASAIKIPLVMEIFKQAQEGRFKLTDVRRVEQLDKTPGSGVLRELGDGTVQMSVNDLCILTILVSDNTATNMLIDLAGMENINRTMQSLGLKQTILQRRMMDLTAGVRGDDNLSTPFEAARLMQILHRGEFVNRTVCDNILAILKKTKTTPIGAGLPPGTAIASKPGGIPGAKTEWAIVLLKQRPYILTIMENYGMGEEAPAAIKDISHVLYEYHWRLEHATPHGWYVPTEIKDEPGHAR